jgi:hypothetical protein
MEFHPFSGLHASSSPLHPLKIAKIVSERVRSICSLRAVCFVRCLKSSILETL